MKPPGRRPRFPCPTPRLTWRLEANGFRRLSGAGRRLHEQLAASSHPQSGGQGLDPMGADPGGQTGTARRGPSGRVEVDSRGTPARECLNRLAANAGRSRSSLNPRVGKLRRSSSGQTTPAARLPRRRPPGRLAAGDYESTGQGPFRPTPATARLNATSSGSGSTSGRQAGVETSPGSNNLYPSKNRRTSLSRRGNIG